MQGRRQRSLEHRLDLPPLFRGVALREVGDAFAHAQSIAAAQGAGTLVHVGRFDLSEFAVVLEPEEPLGVARRAFYACMVALRDALIAHAPAERTITFSWPDAIYVDAGLVGGGRLAWPADTTEDAVPDWLVFGASIRLVSLAGKDAGLRPLVTTLDEEGFTDIGSSHLVESFARHLMVAMDAWRTNEFSTVLRTYIAHVDREKGATPSLDGHGDMLVGWRGQVVPDRRSLLEALAVPSWLDPASGGPKT
jgi:Biotin/lipoate A/B protein ligase family